MFWNFCKSSRRKGLFYLLIGVIYALTLQDSQSVDFQECGWIYKGYSLNKGKNAGIFKRLSRTKDHEKCVQDCCNDNECETALFVGKLQACYSVECRTDDACRPVRASKESLRYNLTIFKKNTQVKDGVDTSISGHKSCHHYHGTKSGCKVYLTNKLLYFDEPPVKVEKRLISPIKTYIQKLSPGCLNYTIASVCHYAFPYCIDRSQPKPMFLCQEDCNNLYQGVCKRDFEGLSSAEKGFLPNCSTLPSSAKENCIKLGVPEPSVQEDKQTETTPSKVENDDDLNLFKQQINKQSNRNSAHQSSESHNETNIDNKQTNYGKTNDDAAFNDAKPSLTPITTTATKRKVPNEDSDDDPEEASKQSMRVDGDSEGRQNISTRTTSMPTKTLGLKKSLNLLEPTASDTNNINNTTLPTEASPTIVKHSLEPTLVNVSKSSHDGIDLDVREKPTVQSSGGTSSSATAKPTEAQGKDSSSKSVSATQVPTLGSVKPTPSTTASKKPTTTTIENKKPTAKATEAPPTLQVSAGRNKVLTLPSNSIELYASAFPKETSGNPYAYHWQQVSSPQDSHGYMEGKDTRRVILTKLSHVGVYQFKVTVKGTTNGAFGFAYVNVTVKPVPRVNKPPRADISPKEQVITLPTNGVVLDGSKSSDDDKIVQYKWEEVKGPLNDKNKMISSGVDSPVLQLKSLVPGIYTFKLTVVDSDGEKDETTATVTVNDEKDYPPVARAGNDVVLTLPVDHVTLNGNSSTDNKGIVSYEWSKAPTSPAVGDMQGTNSPFLKVSNMVVGDYTFILKVTDTGGLSSTSKVTVVVQPEKNMPPVAKAGSDKDLVYPDDSTTLDATESHDDQKIVKYHWEQESGPSKAEISGADVKVATVKKLQEGHYIFKLVVTDDKGLTGSDTVAVSVKKDINKPPVARAGPDVIVHLPNRAAELDGSKSTDDHGITKYLWLRDPKSPAAGDVINKSDHQAILRLSNLVEGMYKFKLTVMDAKGLKSSDEALLTVKEDEHSAHLVELYLDVDITRFTEENKGQLIRKLAVILDVQDNDIVVEHLKEAGTGHSMMVMFYVKGGTMTKDGQAVAEMLKAKIENEEGFFEFRMLKVEPYICRNNCSFHGYCDRHTKLCVCESFWMQDIFKSSFGVKESNCDWSILYVTVIIFGIVMAIGGVIWAICFCLGRRRRGRSRRRHRYAIIDEDEDDKAESMEMLPKHKYSSLTLTDSDEDSDETTLFEAKKRIPNGSLNGSVGRKAM